VLAVALFAFARIARGDEAHPGLYQYRRVVNGEVIAGVEAYLERRGDAGLGFRMFVGGAFATKMGGYSCSDTTDDRDRQACDSWQPPKHLPYFGGSLVF
jgi:hypothetical protein